MLKKLRLTHIFVLLFFQAPVSASDNVNECQIGRMVKEISNSIYNYHDPNSLDTIVKYGTDSRYYVMIRGWLVQEKKGIESQAHSIKLDAKKEAFERKLKVLNQFIRRIDLE